MRFTSKNSKYSYSLIFGLFLICLILAISPLHVLSAQDSPVPYYIIEPGETLTDIAVRFGINLNSLISANGIINPDLISPGTRIIIPGLEGIDGVLTTKTVGIAETLDSFTKKEGIALEGILKLNKITSPNEVYAGSNLIIPVSETRTDYDSIHFSANLTDIEFALIGDLNPWMLENATNPYSNSRLIASDIIGLESNKIDFLYQSGLGTKIRIDPLPIKQGSTHVIFVKTKPDAEIKGTLGESILQFFSYGEESAAIQGINALADPGLVRLSIHVNNDGNVDYFEQMILLESGGFISDPPLLVSDETIDPAIMQPENNIVLGLVNNITSDKYWTGNFIYPVDEPIGFMSVFGNRRSYNNGAYLSFHTGLDFGVYANSLNIYAAESGIVVFAAPLTVRGNAVFINHGRGIFSGYFHQSEVKVKVGDFVTKGQLIGLIGSTGRVTGPHLHWEIWANGFQVDPIEWVNKSIP